MTDEITKLSEKVNHLKSISNQDQYLDCEVMQNYAITQFSKYKCKVLQLERLSATNKPNTINPMLKELRQTMGMLGLYIMV